MEKFSVTLPLTGEYLTTVRLTTGFALSLVLTWTERKILRYASRKAF